ncbi:MAG: glycoside hydrolase [Bacteroidales bacterium]|nr:glycoside hydrolase [Bacteroidales bacterium]
MNTNHKPSKTIFSTLCLPVLAAFLLSVIIANPLTAQIRLPAYDQRINPELLDAWSAGNGHNNGRWSASWITSPDADCGYGVRFFRKSLTLGEKPDRFIIHVSADNRYKLYVNGTQVAAGPAKGDVRNWSFDTVDIAPWLKAGDNLVAAVVWNFAEQRPVALMSLGQSGFLVQGNTEAERALDTGKEWKVLKTDAYSPEPVQVRGYYAAGCTDRLDGEKYPWGWEQPAAPGDTCAFADSSWSAARTLSQAALKGAGNYHLWYLVPRPIPPMEVKPIQMQHGLNGKVIPAGSTASFLIDNKELTTGYPRLHFSGGAGAEITLGYAEALFEQSNGWAKGDRNVTEGKVFVGYRDVILPDGGEGRSFEPLWWRTWRYLQLTVNTADEPLILDSLTAVSSMYPFERESTFETREDPSLKQMLDIGWRTARLCAHETYMDCPYYEQLQYFGDARIQALVTMFNTRDTCLVRNLLEQGRQSLNADGLMASRYPSHILQDIAPYALFWLNTCHDWWMYRGDESYLKTLLPAMRSTLRWFSERLGPDGLLHHVPSWNFADWANLANGSFPTDAEGRSAYLDLIHILALRDAAEMEDAFGDPWFAAGYRRTAEKAVTAAKSAYWVPEKQLFADDGARKAFSQHVNALAILADLVTGPESADLLKRTLNDKDLRPCTIYFRYYLQRAMAHSGCGEEYLSSLGFLHDQMALGLTTWAEMPEPSRSDCHAWGSSPNIEFFRTVLGIDAVSAGFRKVRVAPALGTLQEVSGSIPHPRGTVTVAYKRSSTGKLNATVTLPEGVEGIFIWNGRTRPLRPGENRLYL